MRPTFRKRVATSAIVAAAYAWTSIHSGCASDPTPSDAGQPALPADGGSERDSAAPEASPPDAAKPEDASKECRSEFVPTADCKHPAVQAQCVSGYCRIPAGCFVMGSPECQLRRGANSEAESQVTLTHSFEIGQHEVTQREWIAAGMTNAAQPPMPDAGMTYGSCLDPECPATNFTWFDAVEFANRTSRAHSPPLPECYVLDGCTGTPGAGMKCTSVRSSTENVYECSGYRLPTEAEWEYSARAGTRTPYYSGNMVETSYDPTKECYKTHEPNLDKIAWYCATAISFSPRITRTSPVMLKAPNAWGIYDQLGNVAEWTNGEYRTLAFRGGPHIDPGNTFVVALERTKRGGGATSSAGATTVSWRTGAYWDQLDGLGVRLVRTLP